jgi:phosphatidylserine/phosphatidylglycerophosphate/cardiolipin synthase-like enzyme
MNSNFFTNEEENTLKNKINHILQRNKNVEYLDFLIGYFRITGFDKISDNLSSIKHTRILVGINADKHTYNASQLIKKFSKEQVDIHNEEPLDEQEYQNFFSMKQLIREKKIEVRISANRDVHSKMYIMRSEEHPNHKGDGVIYNGSLIIGSSNLTHNGLEGNTEINAELNQERDIIEAVKVFEKLWAESVELTQEDFDEFITPNLKEPMVTPFQLYIKLLIEHFGKRIDFIGHPT